MQYFHIFKFYIYRLIFLYIRFLATCVYGIKYSGRIQIRNRFRPKHPDLILAWSETAVLASNKKNMRYLKKITLNCANLQQMNFE